MAVAEFRGQLRRAVFDDNFPLRERLEEHLEANGRHVSWDACEEVFADAQINLSGDAAEEVEKVLCSFGRRVMLEKLLSFAAVEPPKDFVDPAFRFVPLPQPYRMLNDILQDDIIEAAMVTIDTKAAQRAALGTDDGIACAPSCEARGVLNPLAFTVTPHGDCLLSISGTPRTASLSVIHAFSNSVLHGLALPGVVVESSEEEAGKDAEPDCQDDSADAGGDVHFSNVVFIGEEFRAVVLRTPAAAVADATTTTMDVIALRAGDMAPSVIARRKCDTTLSAASLARDGVTVAAASAAGAVHVYRLALGTPGAESSGGEEAAESGVGADNGAEDLVMRFTCKHVVTVPAESAADVAVEGGPDALGPDTAPVVGWVGTDALPQPAAASLAAAAMRHAARRASRGQARAAATGSRVPTGGGALETVEEESVSSRTSGAGRAPADAGAHASPAGGAAPAALVVVSRRSGRVGVLELAALEAWEAKGRPAAGVPAGETVGDGATKAAARAGAQVVAEGAGAGAGAKGKAGAGAKGKGGKGKTTKGKGGGGDVAPGGGYAASAPHPDAAALLHGLTRAEAKARAAPGTWLPLPAPATTVASSLEHGGRHVVVGCRDGSSFVLDVVAGVVTAALPAHSASVTAVALWQDTTAAGGRASAASLLVLTAGADRRVCCCAVRAGPRAESAGVHAAPAHDPSAGAPFGEPLGDGAPRADDGATGRSDSRSASPVRSHASQRSSATHRSAATHSRRPGRSRAEASRAARPTRATPPPGVPVTGEAAARVVGWQRVPDVPSAAACIGSVPVAAVACGGGLRLYDLRYGAVMGVLRPEAGMGGGLQETSLCKGPVRGSRDAVAVEARAGGIGAPRTLALSFTWDLLCGTAPSIANACAESMQPADVASALFLASTPAQRSDPATDLRPLLAALQAPEGLHGSSASSAGRSSRRSERSERSGRRSGGHASAASLASSAKRSASASSAGGQSSALSGAASSATGRSGRTGATGGKRSSAAPPPPPPRGPSLPRVLGIADDAVRAKFAREEGARTRARRTYRASARRDAILAALDRDGGR